MPAVTDNALMRMIWRGRAVPVHARRAEGEERERLWARLVALDDGYEEYQRRTGRALPVVVLEPRA